MRIDIRPIPETHKKGWTTKINGQERSDIQSIELHNPNVGTLMYGLHPGGFDIWGFHENGGGGAFTIPHSKDPNGELLLGLIVENRPNMGGEALCAIGGFVDPGESHAQAAAREASEEAGIAYQSIPSPGIPGCCNRLFVWADIHDGEGNHTYLQSVPFEDLEFLEDEQRWSLKKEAQAEIPKGESGRVRLMPWRQAILQCGGTIGRECLAQAVAILL